MVDENPPPVVPLDQQIACVRRELAMRKNVYSKRVRDGKMKQADADREIAAMQAVHDTLTGCWAREPGTLEFLWRGDCGHVWRKDQAENCPICALGNHRQFALPQADPVPPQLKQKRPRDRRGLLHSCSANVMRYAAGFGSSAGWFSGAPSACPMSILKRLTPNSSARLIAAATPCCLRS